MNRLTVSRAHRATRVLVAATAAVAMLAALVLTAGPAEAGGVQVYGSGASDVTATATTSSIHLHWTNPAPVRDALFTGMTIRRVKGGKATELDTGGALVANTGATTTSYNNTGLSIGTEYSYSFFAHFKGGSIALTTFTAYTLTKSVSDLRVTGSTPTSISLSWKVPAAGDFTGTYMVRDNGTTPPSNPNHSYDNEVTIGTLSAHTTHYTDIGLDAGTKYSYALFAEDKNGQTSAEWIKTGTKSISWTLAATGSLNDDVACPTTSFCAAVGGGISADTWNGHSWTSPDQWDNPGGEVGELASVSCSSPAYCVGTDDFGNSTTWIGGRWSGAQHVDSDSGYGFGDISCVKGAEFCIALDSDGHEFTYHDGVWGAAKLVDSDGADTLYSVSCVKENFCVAADGEGNAFIFNGAHWSRQADGVTDAVSLSCASTSFCMVLSSTGDTATYNGHSWKDAGTAIDNSNDLGNAISCVSSSFCMAVSENGYESLYSGVPPEGGGGFGGGTWGDVGGWSADKRVASSTHLFTVSCASTTLCAVTGENDSTYDGYTFFGKS